MVLLGELDELTLAYIVAKPKLLLAHARADLDTYGQKEASIVTTPMVFGAQLLKPDLQIKLDENKCEQLATLPFCSLIGSLMYPATETRSDIMFTVSKLSHFLGCYCEAHQQAAI